MVAHKHRRRHRLSAGDPVAISVEAITEAATQPPTPESPARVARDARWCSLLRSSIPCGGVPPQGSRPGQGGDPPLSCRPDPAGHPLRGEVADVLPPEIEVPVPQFGRQQITPVDPGWLPVEAATPPAVAPGSQSVPPPVPPGPGEWTPPEDVAAAAHDGDRQDLPAPRWVRSATDDHLHLVVTAEIIAAQLVSYARAVCGRLIYGHQMTAATGPGNGFCVACSAEAQP